VRARTLLCCFTSTDALASSGDALLALKGSCALEHQPAVVLLAPHNAQALLSAAEFVLIGEASHGTGKPCTAQAQMQEEPQHTWATRLPLLLRSTQSLAPTLCATSHLSCLASLLAPADPHAEDFYCMRADLTKLLISERGFNAGKQSKGQASQACIWAAGRPGCCHGMLNSIGGPQPSSCAPRLCNCRSSGGGLCLPPPSASHCRALQCVPSACSFASATRLNQQRPISPCPAVVVEADFPDAFRLNLWVRGLSQDATPEAALADFVRFPTWQALES